MEHGIHRQARVKHVVVQTSELRITLRPLAERVGIACSGIQREIVQFEHFLEVREVVLAPVCLEVLHQVRKSGYRPAVIERAVPVQSGQRTLIGSRVTITYPFRWRFNLVVPLIAPKAKYPGSVFTLTTDAFMMNI